MRIEPEPDKDFKEISMGRFISFLNTRTKTFWITVEIAIVALVLLGAGLAFKDQISVWWNTGTDYEKGHNVDYKSDRIFSKCLQRRVKPETYAKCDEKDPHWLVCIGQAIPEKILRECEEKSK